MPGVRGAHVRAEDHGYEPRPGRFLASEHIAQQMAWLQAEITWSAIESAPELESSGEVTIVEGEASVAKLAGSGSLTIPVGGDPMRQHALAYVLQVDGDGPIGFELAAREAAEWKPAATYETPGAGTYLGFVALEKKPRTIEAVRVSLDGAREVVIYDLALLTFG